jgi:hypothetical protein
VRGSRIPVRDAWTYPEIVTRRVTWLRLAALLSAGTLAVHELRYLAAYGRDTDQALSEQGHAYLTAVGPLVALLLALVAAGLVRAAARGRFGGGGRFGFRRGWLTISTTIYAIFAAQESIEGLLAGGHASGLAAVFANGGWLAIVFALAVGALLAWLVREMPAAAAATTRGLRAPLLCLIPAPHLQLAAADATHRAAGAPRHLAPRGPPATSA